MRSLRYVGPWSLPHRQAQDGKVPRPHRGQKRGAMGNKGAQNSSGRRGTSPSLFVCAVAHGVTDGRTILQDHVASLPRQDLLRSKGLRTVNTRGKEGSEAEGRRPELRSGSRRRSVGLMASGRPWEEVRAVEAAPTQVETAGPLGQLLSVIMMLIILAQVVKMMSIVAMQTS